MKVVFINCSPKRKFSASSYFLSLQRLLVKGEKKTETLRSKKEHERIMCQLRDADSVVFALPMYVDGIPSHVLRFLKEMEQFCKTNNLHLNVYSISNNGFIEGSQNEPLLQVFQNFCKRSGLFWCGGVGIGGGVMLNVTRVLFVVQIGLLLLNMLLSGFQSGNFFPADAMQDFAVNFLILLFLNLGVLYYILRMGKAINRKEFLGKKYTRILIPSFIFILNSGYVFYPCFAFSRWDFQRVAGKKESVERLVIKVAEALFMFIQSLHAQNTSQIIICNFCNTIGPDVSCRNRSIRYQI